jgi:hypothetical protein
MGDLSRGRHPLGREADLVDGRLLAAAVILDRATGEPAFADQPEGLRHAGRLVREGILEVSAHRQVGGGRDRGRVPHRLLTRERPIRSPERPRKPLLVVASAWKPSEASSFAEPQSHGFGSNSGASPSCNSRNRLARSDWPVMKPPFVKIL